MTYYYDRASTDPAPYAFDVINSSGDYYTTTTSANLTISSNTDAIQVSEGPTID